jgi:hypothetical protein
VNRLNSFYLAGRTTTGNSDTAGNANVHENMNGKRNTNANRTPSLLHPEGARASAASLFVVAVKMVPARARGTPRPER